MDLYSIRTETVGGVAPDFQPDIFIEGYKSLIWTERYMPAGDFELKTALVDETRAALPLGAFVTIKDSPECMIVESHVIDRDPDGAMELTVTGRSFESFFENRVANEAGVRMFTIDGDNNTEALTDAQRLAKFPYNWDMANPAANPTGNAGARYIHEMLKVHALKTSDTGTFIKNLTVTIDPTADMPAKPKRYLNLKVGTVYEKILEILAMDDLGIRTILPVPGQVNMNLRVFAGVDRSNDVILSVSAGHFDKVSYVFTTRDYKNAVVSISQWDWLETNNPALTGLNRRTGFLDASDIQLKSGAANPTQGARIDRNVLPGRNAAYLGQHKQNTVFSGEVSPNIPYLYGPEASKQFFLGDLVLVVGDYGVKQKMRVSEYTRIDDAEGSRAFPTLELP